MLPEAEAFFRARVRNPHVLERVLRLNAGIREGDLIRGWRKDDGHPGRSGRYVIGKRRFIAQHGRAAWDALPNGVKWRNGRRQWASALTAAILSTPSGGLDVRALLMVRLVHRDGRFANDLRHRCHGVCLGEWLPLYANGQLIR